MISQQKLGYIFYIIVTCLQIDHVTTKEDALQSRRLSSRSLQMKNLSDYFNVITVKLQILYTNHCQSVYITIEHTLIFQVVIYYMTHSLRLLTLTLSSRISASFLILVLSFLGVWKLLLDFIILVSSCLIVYGNYFGL